MIQENIIYPEYINFNGEKAKLGPIKGYYATKSGKILSVKVKGGCGKVDFLNPREHSWRIDRYGYKVSCFNYIDDNGNSKKKYITHHRFIYETFNGKIPKELTVDHKNNDKLKNELSNLQLLTHIENCIKRNKDWSKDRRNKYKVFINSEFIEILDTIELNEKYGITSDNLKKYNKGKNVRRIINLNMKLEKV